MPWARFDDSFYDHIKLDNVSDAAVGFFLRAICWSNRHLTDGKIGTKWRKKEDKSGKKTAQLLRAGLFEQHDDGSIWVHDFLDYSRSRSDILADREKVKNRVQRHRRNGVTNADVTPSPTRPDPSRPVPIVDTNVSTTSTSVWTDGDPITGGADLEAWASQRGLAAGSIPMRTRRRAKQLAPILPHEYREAAEIHAHQESPSRYPIAYILGIIEQLRTEEQNADRPPATRGRSDARRGHAYVEFDPDQHD